MPSKKEIQAQIDALNKQLEGADDEYEDISVTRDKDGNETFSFKAKKTDPKFAWLFGTDDESDEDDAKQEPEPKARTKYFGG